MVSGTRLRMAAILTLGGVLGLAALAGPSALAASAFRADVPAATLAADLDGDQPTAHAVSGTQSALVPRTAPAVLGERRTARRPARRGHTAFALGTISSPLRR